MGQHVTATGVKFRPGSPSTLSEKVASGLVWRFGNIDCVSHNLDYLEDGFGDNGSFTLAATASMSPKPFPEEVTDISDPLSDLCSICSESSDLGAMVKVLALKDGEGGGLPCTARPLPEQDAPPPERDILDTTIMDLRAPLDLTTDPIKIAKNLEQTRTALLSKVVDIKDTRRCMNSMLREYNTVQGFTPAGSRDLGMELNRATPSARSPPVIAKPTYSTPSKNLHAVRYITSKLLACRARNYGRSKLDSKNS
jgi:hypothetical protein